MGEGFLCVRKEKKQNINYYVGNQFGFITSNLCFFKSSNSYRISISCNVGFCSNSGSFLCSVVVLEM
jgi:hypothetical protein